VAWLAVWAAERSSRGPAAGIGPCPDRHRPPAVLRSVERPGCRGGAGGLGRERDRCGPCSSPGRSGARQDRPARPHLHGAPWATVNPPPGGAGGERSVTVVQVFRDEPTGRQQRLPPQAAGARRRALPMGMALGQGRPEAGGPLPPEPHRFRTARSGAHAECDLAGFLRLPRQPGRPDALRPTADPHSGALVGAGGLRRMEATAESRGRMLSAPVRPEAGCRHASLTVQCQDPRSPAGPGAGSDVGLWAAVSGGRGPAAPKWAKGRNRLGPRSAVRRAPDQRQGLRPATMARVQAEALRVSGGRSGLVRVRNRKRSRSGAAHRWSEFRRRLAGQIQSCRSLASPRFLPSIRTCLACGAARAEMPPAERVCARGVGRPEIRGDRNAARHLAAPVAGEASDTQNACGIAHPVQPAGRESLGRKRSAPMAGKGRP